MKRTLLLLALLALTVTASAEGKKRLTDEEILYGPKAELLKSVPTPLAFDADGKLIFRQGREVRSYDSRRKTTAKSEWTAPRNVDSFSNKVEGWVNPTWSPDSSRIAYTLDNDLYSMEVATGRITRHTFDGSDLILNGYASWVYYEEIFGRPSQYRAFWWSPDSRILAYYRFDNSKVPMFPIYVADGLHGYLNQTRYPKAGDTNPTVKIGFVSVSGSETVWADFDPSRDQYFGIPFWSGDGTRFMVAWMPRSQDDLELFSIDPFNGRKESVYKEHQDCWIDWMEEMLFTKEGIYIVRDYTGWEQIHFLSYDGRRNVQLTEGHNWSIRLLKVDSKYLFYSAKREDATRVDIYRVRLKDHKLERVSFGDYSFDNIVISEDGRNIATVASNARTPHRLYLISIPASGRLDKAVTTLVADSRGRDFDDYQIALPEIFRYTTRDGYDIPVQVIWPLDMDTTRKYPVKVNIYGGPNSPQVKDVWAGLGKQWWAYHGVIQVTLDNRAGGSHGKRVLEHIYRQLAVVEIQDFIDGISYFRELPYVDRSKVGIEGFSFGGTMTTLCVTEAGEYFPYGIAGGGVYDWALYDSHYTERYMDTPQDNPDGYARSRVIDRVGAYKGDGSNMLRITHGTSDDNVHFQNTLQLIGKLQKDHKDFELMVYPGAYHGYRGDQNLQSRLQDYKFWYRYLLGEELPEILFRYYSQTK